MPELFSSNNTMTQLHHIVTLWAIALVALHVGCKAQDTKFPWAYSSVYHLETSTSYDVFLCANLNEALEMKVALVPLERASETYLNDTGYSTAEKVFSASMSKDVSAPTIASAPTLNISSTSTGSLYQVSFLPAVCSGHGYFNGSNCVCESGYSERIEHDSHVCVSVAECGGHGHLHGDECHCDEGYEVDPSDKSKCIKHEDDDHSAHHDEECGGHGHLHGDECHCDEGYEVDPSDKSKCIKHEDDDHSSHHDEECGGHGHLHGDECHCDEGFVVDSSDSSICIKARRMMRALAQGKCGGHGHLHGKTCHCDDGYKVDPSDGTNCVSKSTSQDRSSTVADLDPTTNCGQLSQVKLIIETPESKDHIGIFTEHAFKIAVVRSSNKELVSSEMCTKGCEMEWKNTTSKSVSTLEINHNRWGLTIIGALIASCTAFIGVLFLLMFKGNQDRINLFIQMMTSFAAGTLLSTVFLHILPEASEKAGLDVKDWELPVMVIAGVVFAMLFEQGLHMVLHKHGAEGHDHEHGVVRSSSLTESAQASFVQNSPYEDEHAAKKTRKISFKFQWTPFKEVKGVAWVCAVGDFNHAFADGILIAIAFKSCDVSTGWLVTLSIVLHEIPHRIGDFFIFLDSGMTVVQAICIDFVSSLSSLIGATIILSAGDISGVVLAYLLSFGSGSLLFIAMTSVLPRVVAVMDLRLAITNFFFFALGCVVLGLSMMFHGHCDPISGEMHLH